MNSANKAEKMLQESLILCFTYCGLQNKIHLKNTVYKQVLIALSLIFPHQLTHQDAFHLPMERFHFKDSVDHLIIFICSEKREFSQEADQELCVLRSICKFFGLYYSTAPFYYDNSPISPVFHILSWEHEIEYINSRIITEKNNVSFLSETLEVTSH